MDSLREASALFAPLLLGFVCHGLCIKTGFLRGLARPLDAGARWRGRRVFGDNKTYRGIVVVAIGTGLGYLALGRFPFGFGLLVGAAAMCAELPNSFLKRQLEIAPGGQARGPRGAVFHVLDQIDVTVGAWLVLALRVRPTPALVLASLAFIFVTHQAITVAGYALGMRATWR
ncbi:MAG TPA: CDP-archaeol synthase [Vicinamibacteria bacterium]|nr:CDP-archaeol synthase [Vicinamibacteria bacterium]